LAASAECGSSRKAKLMSVRMRKSSQSVGYIDSTEK
jgi:hypothetical protein